MATKLYQEFLDRFSLLSEKNKKVVVNTLSNIFTMRQIGNKTHGDLAEIGIAEFINQFMYDYSSKHVGKDMFRKKEHEEDIVIRNDMNGSEIPVSMKAYGDGPLQLSTDKKAEVFCTLNKLCPDGTDDIKKIRKILQLSVFDEIKTINILPLIYREKVMKCNILVFNTSEAINDVGRIVYVAPQQRDDGKYDKGRKHPIFMFESDSGEYIFEVRYGNKEANALQRGIWTNTKKASQYFTSITKGWIDYKLNQQLLALIGYALNATEDGHAKANNILQEDIDGLRNEK